MPIEIAKETHLIVDKIAYLDASIDKLSDEDIKWINEKLEPSEENKSVPFKPL